jgi:hypothetical protein
MCIGIIRKVLRLYRNNNGIYEIVVIDPKEWDWWYVYGSDRPPGPIGTVFEARDREGHLQLVKISEFGEWKISEFGEGLVTAMSPEAQALQSDETLEKVSQEACSDSSSEPQAARQPAAAKPAELGFPVKIAEGSQRRYLTGGPGRPTPMHLVEEELDRRIASLKPGEFLGQNITEVAELLATWWKQNKRPEEAPLTAKAIMNSLRASIRKHVSAFRARN